MAGTASEPTLQGAIVALHDSYGFIKPDEGGDDHHFRIDDFGNNRAPGPDGVGRRVEFHSTSGNKGPRATQIRLLDERESDLDPWLNPGALGQTLEYWADIPLFEPCGPKDNRYPSALHWLDDLALDERWHFGAERPSARPFPLLESYLKYTFVRLVKEDRANRAPPNGGYIRISRDGGVAAFNTGLVDRLYKPIFALFLLKSASAARPWRFYAFCLPGVGPGGRRLSAAFPDLPPPARYITSAEDVLFDPDARLDINIPHVLEDGISRDRLPFEFLRQSLEATRLTGCAWEDYSAYPAAKRKAYLELLAEALFTDDNAALSILTQIEGAIERARKRVRWNYKTAIPTYYPRFNEMNFLLPLALARSDEVDATLVVARCAPGVYEGKTLYRPEWAYRNARLVCRPDSDWLVPERLGQTALGEDPDALGSKEDEAWYSFVAECSPGSEWDGEVQNVVDYGVFVDFPHGVTGLIHISKISGQDSSRFQRGDSLRVEILDIDEVRRRISLAPAEAALSAPSAPVLPDAGSERDDAAAAVAAASEANQALDRPRQQAVPAGAAAPSDSPSTGETLPATTSNPPASWPWRAMMAASGVLLVLSWPWRLSTLPQSLLSSIGQPPDPVLVPLALISLSLALTLNARVGRRSGSLALWSGGAAIATLVTGLLTASTLQSIMPWAPTDGDSTTLPTAPPWVWVAGHLLFVISLTGVILIWARDGSLLRRLIASAGVAGTVAYAAAALMPSTMSGTPFDALYSGVALLSLWVLTASAWPAGLVYRHQLAR